MKVETWNTRFGMSVRTVHRTKDGRFINNKSAKQLRRKQMIIDPAVFVRSKIY